MNARERVEQAAIAAAEHYAAAYGHPGDRTAAGLFLAGLVIGARCDEATRLWLVAGYREQFPGEDGVMDRWAATIGRAAR